MNERLTIQDLTDLLAAKHGMSKKDAEAFVKEFFLLIEQALENEKNVKIKGLGTFRLIDVDSRESVNVNTGERFQIKGHTKVSFVPDTNLREVINKPFAHFETVVLNENTLLEDTPMEETEEEETGEETSTPIVENVEDLIPEVIDHPILEITESEKVDESVQEEIISEEPVIEKVIIEEAKEEDPIVEDEEKQEIEDQQEENPDLENVTVQHANEQPEVPVVELQPEPAKEDTEITAEKIIAQELLKANLKPVISEIQPNAVNTERAVSAVPKKEKSPVPYLIGIIIVVLLLCGGAILFIYYPDMFSSAPNKEVLDMPVATQPIQPETQIADTMERKDTVAEATPDVPKETVLPQTQAPVKKEVEVSVQTESKVNPKQPSTAVYSDSAIYTITGTKASHTIKEGETLTRVALRFYGTKALWPYIVKHNPGVIKNPDNVPYGTTIKIPELEKK